MLLLHHMFTFSTISLQLSPNTRTKCARHTLALCTQSIQTVFIWRESSSINIDVRINLDRSDPQSTGLEYSANTTGNYPFPNTTDYSARHQNVLHNSAITWYSYVKVTIIYCDWADHAQVYCRRDTSISRTEINTPSHLTSQHVRQQRSDSGLWRRPSNCKPWSMGLAWRV